MKSKQLLKLIDTSGKNSTLAVRTDSSNSSSNDNSSSNIEKNTRKQQKAVKKSKSVNQVNR